MPSSVDLGPKLEGVVSKLVSKGRYGSKSEVIRAGVRMIEEREKNIEALNRALERGLADVKAGRLYTADEVFGAVHERIREVAARRRTKSA